jgi:hypothetical protein
LARADRLLSERKRQQLQFFLLAAACLLGSGCGLDYYEQQMVAEQNRLKYLDEENQNLEGSPLKLPEQKVDDKEAVHGKDFFFRPPRGISTTPDAKPIGILYRYPSTDPNGNVQDMFVAVVKKDATDKFRNEVLQTIQSLGLRAAGQVKTREVGVQAGHPLRYDYYELQGAPNQPAGSVYFYHEVVQGEGAYQVAIVFRGTASSPAGIANDSPVLELALASLRVDSAARLKHSQFRPVPQSAQRKRR